MARRMTRGVALMGTVAAVAGCLPKFAPPSATEIAGTVDSIHSVSKASPHPQTPGPTAPATRTPVNVGESGGTPAPFGASPTSGSTGGTPSPGSGTTPSPGASGSASTPSPGSSTGTTGGTGGTGSADPDLPSPVATLNDASPTPTPPPAATDVVYLDGNFQSSLLAGGGADRPADGNGNGAILGLSGAPQAMLLLNQMLYFTDAAADQVRTLGLASPFPVANAFGDPTRRYSGADPTIAYMQLPGGLVIDAAHKFLYCTDDSDARIYRLGVSTSGLPTSNFNVIAGGRDSQGQPVPYRDGPGSGASATDSARAGFATPKGLALVGTTLYVAEADGHRIRKIDLSSSSYNVTTLLNVQVPLGAPASATEQDDRTSAKLNGPTALVASLDGKTLYIADTNNSLIRALDLSSDSSKVTVFAGIPNSPGYKDGPFGTAAFNGPMSLAIDKSYLYVGERGGVGGNYRVRAISLADKSVKTVLGTIRHNNTVGDKNNATFESVTGLYADLNGDSSLKALYVYDGGFDDGTDGDPKFGARLLKITP